MAAPETQSRGQPRRRPPSRCGAAREPEASALAKERPSMRVLGLDPGSRRTGWGVVERQARSLRCLAAGHVAPPARLSLPERLHAIVREVNDVMERFSPDCVVIGEAFHHSYVRSTP